MASVVATQHFLANNKIEMFTHMPAAGATEQSIKAGATATTWKDLRDYAGFAVAAVQGVLGGSGMIELSIYAAIDDAGTSATEIKTSGVIAADAIGDYAMLECSAEEINQIGRAAGLALRYVAGYIDSQHNDDEQGVVYIRFGAKFAYLNLSGNYISA